MDGRTPQRWDHQPGVLISCYFYEANNCRGFYEANNCRGLPSMRGR